MSNDYYKTLGIEKGASQAEVKKAFYKLAQKYHPDKPGGDEAKFKEANEAYQILSDEKKRAQYDQFGSSAFSGGGGRGQGGFDFSQFGGQNGFNFNFGGGNVDLEDILSQTFGFGFGGQRTPRGRDFQLDQELTFKEAILGVEKEIAVPTYVDGKDQGPRKVKVSIPAGVETGQRLKLAGYGEKLSDGNTGDLYVQFRVAKHPSLHREGMHLVTNLEVKLTDAILGAKYPLETLDGKTSIKVPAGLKTGEILRLRGQGVGGRGDLLIKTSIKIPKKLSKTAKKAIEILQREGI